MQSTRKEGCITWRSAILRMLCLLFGALATNAYGQDRTLFEDYDTLIAQSHAISPVGIEVFGDTTDYNSGATTFHVTDVALEGNSDLEVGFSRSMEAFDSGLRRQFKWTRFDVPYLAGIFPEGSRSNELNGWLSEESAQRGARCSVGTPPEVDQSSGKEDSFPAEEYWHGNFLYLPGSGPSILQWAIATSPQPTAGGPFVWSTESRWYFSCLPSTSNGAGGEAFVGHAPNGRKYYFTHLVRADQVDSIAKPAYGGGTAVLRRGEWRMLATRVEDQNGNWVAYEYSGPDLRSITSNDGRRITVGYQAPGGAVAWVSDQSRTWTYSYEDGVKVTLPDGSRWHAKGSGPGIQRLSQICSGNSPTPRYSGEQTVTISLPAGAIGTFTFRTVRRGLSYVTQGPGLVNCLGPSQSEFDNVALVTKKIEGPGLPAMTWGITYGAANNCYTNGIPRCASSSPTTHTVDVQSPSRFSRYVFGNKYRDNDSALLETHTGTSSSALLRSEYSAWSALPSFGVPVNAAGDRYLRSIERVLDKSTTVQDGVTYSKLTTARDSFRRALTTLEDNSTGTSRTRTTTYHDNPALWRIGQIASESLDGKEVNATAYLQSNALPFQFYSFGRLVQSAAYNADGTLASVTDGNNHTTWLSGWKRGIPQSIRYPATQESPGGATKLASVSDSGLIMSVTDEIGAKTGYSYDVMGRLAGIAYPDGDSTAWNSTKQNFEYVSDAEYGVSPGHWRQTVSTGSGRAVTYFDGLWRPVLVREYDASDEANTRRSTVHQYDDEGRTVFTSYPVASIGSIADVGNGTRTTYDALGRITKVTQASELGDLESTVTYLPGGQALAIDPRKQQKVTRYQMFGEPNYQMPVSIEAGGARTDIVRDVFGKPQRIERYGTP